MSTEVRKEIEIIPAQAKVKEHVLYVYIAVIVNAEVETAIVTTPMPVPIYPGSLASLSRPL